MSSTRSLLWRVGLSALAGLLLGLAYPPIDLGLPLLPLGVAALTLAVHGASVRIGALCGLVTGLVFFLVLLRWLTVIGVDAYLLVTLACALFLAAQGAATSLVTRLRWWPVWVACLWVAQEAARDRAPVGGFPWGRLAFGDQQFVFTRYAAVGGAPLVTFVTALSGALLAWACLNIRVRTAVAVAVLALAVGLPAASNAIPTPQNGKTITVAVVQGNVPRAGLDFEGQRRAVLNNHVEATNQLADDIRAGKVAKPDLVIWPENSSDIDPFHDALARSRIDDAVKAVGVPVLVGAVVGTDDGRNVENAGYVWSPTTGPGERYVKRHLVPFGEYIPFRALLGNHISRLGRITEDFKPGTKPGVLALGPTTVGDVICFEIGYDGIVRDAVRGAGDVIVVQTNNATYGHRGQPQQQALMSRVRAVEHGRSVLVAATSGISQIVEPNGDVVASTPEFQRAVLVRQVPVRTARTLADRVGVLPELALTIVGLSAVAYAVVRRRPATAPRQREHA